MRLYEVAEEKFPRATKIKIIKNCEGVAECNGVEHFFP